MVEPSTLKKKALSSIAAVALLFTLLALTTYALVLSLASAEDNLFETARVDIELNGGKAIFDGADMRIEPGQSLVRHFTVENTGTADAYVRLYLENVAGSLQESLIFQILDQDKLLYSGAADALTRESPCGSDTPLAAGETRTLTAVVKLRESAGNAYQGGGIAFDVTADAVQARHNADKAFE